MNWYNYIACFFAGFFLANVVPHFIHGVSGDTFPTPFSRPPGKGPSSPTVNVVWALFNLVIAYLLYMAGNISTQRISTVVVFFIGIAALSLMTSISFASRVRE